MFEAVVTYETIKLTPVDARESDWLRNQPRTDTPVPDSPFVCYRHTRRAIQMIDLDILEARLLRPVRELFAGVIEGISEVNEHVQ